MRTVADDKEMGRRHEPSVVIELPPDAAECKQRQETAAHNKQALEHICAVVRQLYSDRSDKKLECCRLNTPKKVALYLCTTMTEATDEEIAVHFKCNNVTVAGVTIEVRTWLLNPFFEAHLRQIRRSIEAH